MFTNTKGTIKQFLTVVGVSSAFSSSGLYAYKKLKSLICLWMIGIACTLDSNPNAAYWYSSFNSGFDSIYRLEILTIKTINDANSNFLKSNSKLSS